jgi:hypothetical protein
MQEGGDWEDHGSRPAQAKKKKKKVVRLHLNKQALSGGTYL